MKMKRIGGDLPWMITLIESYQAEQYEIEFYETEDEGNQAADKMIKEGLEPGTQIYISKIVSQSE